MSRHLIDRRAFSNLVLNTLLLAGMPSRKMLAQTKDEKFLFVITATGGASLIDSFLPVVRNATNTGSFTYEESMLEQIPNLPFNVVKPISGNKLQSALPFGNGYSLADFAKAHGADLAAICHEVSSVNHTIAGQRALNGNLANKGRTLSEEFAIAFGEKKLLANCNMATAGYSLPGLDNSIPGFAKGEFIAVPLDFSLSLHGSKNVMNAPGADFMAKARELRNKVEKASPFLGTYYQDPMLVQYLGNRQKVTTDLESKNLIDKLFMKSKDSQNEKLKKVLEVFPELLTDPFQAQAALAFLLVGEGLTSSVTFGPDFNPHFKENGTDKKTVVNAPLGFDFSHTEHRATQNAMWSRIMSTTDGLIKLLKETPYPMGQTEVSGSLWDRSIVYIATEFGRDKNGASGSGHHVNNGSLVISPLIKGGKVYGGINVASGNTLGFKLEDGTTDSQGNAIRESHVYSLITQAAGISFENQKNMSALIK